MAKKRNHHSNPAKETAWEDTPEQVRRRAARTREEKKYEKAHGIKKMPKNKELDHQGFHRFGSLDKVPVKLVSKHANRVRQPPRK